VSELKRGLQWNALILSASPTSSRNLHCSVVFPLKLLGISHTQILSDSSLLCNWVHFPQEIGLHAENKASHTDIFCDPRM